MTNARWDRIKDVFNAALAVPQADRPALVARLCAGDEAIRREVESLLEARTLSIVRTGGAADALAGMTTTSIPDPHAADRVGTMIARYKLLQIIGEGGFGTVYMAEQTEPVRRKVALKVIKPGMDSRAIIARFEAERQALAMMDHPHIARVLDGGVTPLTESGGGLPYFVMEYVVGDAVTRFADAHALSIAERLAVFQQVCSAVQHAHTKGIIHRDLKPANVLVSMVDGKPFAKVIDFGIAKATGAAGGRLTDLSFFTEHRQLIGTPEYMSPEQAEGSLDIDTRTDVYALGVLLYELLTGTTPIEGARLRSAAFDEMRRMIREDEPLAPSMKLSRSLDTLARTAAARKVEPARLSALVKGELDWIVLKALEKERARRYETPSALADDVRRHLAGEAVVAAPVSRAYRVRKFVRRNKGAVSAVGAITVVLLAGVVGTTMAVARASEEKRQKQLVKQRLDTLAEQARAGLGRILDASAGQDTGGMTWRLDDAGERREESERQVLSIIVDAAMVGIRNSKNAQKELEASNSKLLAERDYAEWNAYTANVALAQAALEANDYPGAREVVGRFPKLKIGWEGLATARQAEDALWATSAGPNGGYRAGFGPFPYSVAIPSNNDVQWLDWRTGQQIDAKLPALGGSYAVRSNPSGSVIVAGQFNPSQRLTVHKRTKEEWASSTLATVSSVDIDWSADGSRFAAPLDGKAAVWSPESAVPIATLPHATYGNRCVALSPDGRVLATQVDSDVALWDVDTGAALKKLPCLSSHGWANNPTFSPDGLTLLTSGRSLRQWDANSGRLIREWPIVGSRAEFIAGTTLCVVSGYSDYAIVNLASGVVERGPSGGAVTWDQAISAAVSPDGKHLLLTVFGERPVEQSGAAQFRRIDQLAPSSYSVHGGTRSRAPETDAGTIFARRPMRISQRVAAILASSPNGPSGLTITTPDGSRRIVGGADKTVRFYEAQEGKPTLPATAEQPEGVCREVAVFRMPEAVTNLQMTGDGTRLIIHLEDGSARVWDIRDPEERRKDLQAEWAERVPAGAYLDTLWASDTPDGKLYDAVINDASLSPLRRLVAAEMLEERLEDDRLAAEQAFGQLKQAAEPAIGASGATPAADPASITAAVRAAAAAAELPKRVKARVVALAAGWEYKKPEPSDAERLAEASERLLNAETNLYGIALINAVDRSYNTRRELLGAADSATLEAAVLRQYLQADINLGVNKGEFAAMLELGRDLDSYFAAGGQETWATALMESEIVIVLGPYREEEVKPRMARVERAVRRLAQMSKLPQGAGLSRSSYLSWRLLKSWGWREPFACDPAEAPASQFDAWYVRVWRPVGAEVQAIRYFQECVTPLRELGEYVGFVERLKSIERCGGRNDASLLGLALAQYRMKAPVDALASLAAVLGRRANVPERDRQLVIHAAIHALIRAALSTADDATLAAAAEIDGKAGSLTGGKVLDREGHRAAAREALAKARALMAPAADGTPSPWANDEDAKALLAEAEALIEPREPKR